LSLPDSPQSNIIQFDPERWKIDDASLQQLVKSIVSTVRELHRKEKELEERNRALEEANAELQAALDQAHQRIARFEEESRVRAELQHVTPSPQELAISIKVSGGSSPTLEVWSATGVIDNLREFSQHVGDFLKNVLPSPAASGEVSSPPQAPPARAGGEEGRYQVLTKRHQPDAAPLPTQTVHLVASPFPNFKILSAFHRAIQQIPGVVGAKAVSFREGTLHLSVEYLGMMPLAGRLTELSEFNLRLVSSTMDTLEVTLLD
jgi:hypothetical protein